MLPWTARDVADAVRGIVIGDPLTPVAAVSTDTRTIQPGVCFVAIAGERFDGHDFVATAFASGAELAVVSDPAAASGLGAHVIVPDTGAALRDLAVYRRKQLTMPVAAVTGSSGKTSTKDLMAAALPGSHASPRSYNNEIGVPTTILASPADAAFLVLEVGSRGTGHIAWLMPAIRPDVAVITNLGVVHLETFGTLEALADAKWELVQGLDHTGTAVVPADDSRLHRSHSGATLTFGADSNADIAVDDLEVDELGRPRFLLRTPEGTQRIELPVAGEHQALNAAAAVGAGIALGVPLDVMVVGLETATASPWRMEIHQGRFTVVNDAYNANPDSVLAALKTVAAMPGRHIAVLGKMAELGPIEAEEHRRMGAEAKRLGFDAVVVVGEDPGIADGAGPLAIATSGADALAAVTSLTEPGDVVLVKASRSVGLERLAEELAERAS